MGGSLLAPVSEAMATATEAALRRTKGTIHPGNFWLDITDLLNPKDFITMADKKKLSYKDWSLSSNITEIPDTHNCVYMSEALGYQWMVTSCTDKMNFVCYKAG
ncbi:hypothetical protein DPMN_099185 [Dreissena polymorpha]|uniref:C-type lectin domain-containing protein n=2 Tax=Dreissena polymorpha TaxID=45954 RepID=A0A9D4LF50_DREPO|nr:hypothetical protein DPMN_099185 [Dreissena polymorpha]